MTAPEQGATPRPGGRAEELRGYLQAAGDLSAIARARLSDAARDALRTEFERAGSALGLAGVDEVARLRRTVERLERRLQVLEGAVGVPTRVGRPPSRGAGGPRGPGMRPPRRPGTPAGPAEPLPAAGDSAPGGPEVPGPPLDVGPDAVPTRRAPVRRPRPPGAEPGLGAPEPGPLP